MESPVRCRYCQHGVGLYGMEPNRSVCLATKGYSFYIHGSTRLAMPWLSPTFNARSAKRALLWISMAFTKTPLPKPIANAASRPNHL
jgi:hypothetical protein